MDTSNPNFTHTSMIYTHVCKYNVYVYLLYYVLTAAACKYYNIFKARSVPIR